MAICSTIVCYSSTRSPQIEFYLVSVKYAQLGPTSYRVTVHYIAGLALAVILH